VSQTVRVKLIPVDHISFLLGFVAVFLARTSDIKKDCSLRLPNGPIVVKTWPTPITLVLLIHLKDLLPQSLCYQRLLVGLSLDFK
jgi:hypothetical protein